MIRLPFLLSVLAAISASQLGAQSPSIGATNINPQSIPVGVATSVTITAVISDSSLVAGSANVQRFDPVGKVFSSIGAMRDDGTNGDAVANDRTFSLRLTLTETSPFPVMFRVSAAFRGSLTRPFSAPFTLGVSGATAPGIAITSPPNLMYFISSPVTVTGTITDPTSTVTVNGISAPVANGRFSVLVPLLEGNNIITASARNTQQVTSTSSVQITLDTVAPRVTIDSPFDGLVTTDATLTVTGKANDTVVGTVNNQQVQVTINGVPAQVANRSFQVTSIPLAIGNNVINAVARDRSGNSATARISVRRDLPTQSQIQLVSGNNQAGAVGTQLAQPIVAALVDGAGSPVSGQTVVFSVIQNNGLLPNGQGTQAVITNGSGQASVQWRLGSRSGAGNNVLQATAVGFAGAAIFNATGLAAAPANIVVDTGAGQTGVVGQPLPWPFVAVVTDAGHNRLANVPVTFQFKQGGGNFGGQPILVTNTDSDGRALAIPTLGPGVGIENNVVEATFQGNTGLPAAFSASSQVAGNPAATRISGVILDNSNNPIPGATIRGYLNNVPAQTNVGLPPNVMGRTDAQGQFNLQPAPVGFVKLLVDGSTVQRPGKWPNLEYDLVTVSGQTNTVGMPIYLLPLDSTNQLCVSPTAGGTLTLPNVPGFSLTVQAGSATFPGGSRSGCITVTPVHPDKVPMVPGFGQQPRFIVTIQPAGTLFNPPASISLPNTDGLKAREITEMYSFDHDLASFVSIGTGTVSQDGLIVKSDPGVGVLKAGWFCGGPPTPSGTCCTPPPCNMCQGSGFSADPAKNSLPCNDGKFCTQGDSCLNGVCTGQPVPDTTGASVGVAVNLDQAFSSVEGFLRTLFGNRAPDLGLQVSGNVGTVTQCCEATRSSQVNKQLSAAGTTGISGDFPIPGFALALPFNLGNAGLFATVALSASGTLTAQEDNCQNITTGNVGGQVQMTGGVKGQITLPANVASANIGGSTGLSGGISGPVQRGQISVMFTGGHNGLVASATVQLVNGLIEATGSVVLIQPSTLNPVTVVVPFTL